MPTIVDLLRGSQRTNTQSVDAGAGKLGLPETAPHGTIVQGPDGKNYQYAETRGMVDSDGRPSQSPWGWIETTMAPRGGGFFSRFTPEMLASVSQGLLSGKTGSEQISNAVGNLATAQKEKKQRNMTLELLQGKSPELAQAIQAGILTPKDGFSLYVQEQAERRKAQRPARKFQTLADGTFGWADETDGTWTPLGRAPKSENGNWPALVQEYQFAKENGFEGAFPDYVKLKEGAGGRGGGKAPSGFRWADEAQTRLEPIPGGPGEHISAEQAARVGMANTFLENLPAIRAKIVAGDVTGPWDRALAGSGFGERGQTYQQIQSGVDALIRFMTGAGMNMTEAQEYAGRYLPTYRDTAETAAMKLDRLAQELQGAQKMVMRGRGGVEAVGEIDDLVRKYGG